MAEKSANSKGQAHSRRFIYFSFMNYARTDTAPEIFDYIYNKMTAVAKAYDYLVVWRIPSLLVKRLSENEPLARKYSWVRWTASECRRLLKKAEFAVADTIGEALSALGLGKDTLLMYEKEIPEENRGAVSGAFVSSGFEGILREAQKRMSGDIPVPMLFDCPKAIGFDNICETVGDAMYKDPVERAADRAMLSVWEQYGVDKEKIIRLRESRKYDELLLLFDKLNTLIKRYPDKMELQGWDSEVKAAFLEVREIQGETK